VESISRLSRNSSVAFRVEDELRTAGVRLCAADEPLEESFGTIVLRHVNIGIARGYHHELMVKSRQGLETSTRQGWHTGGVALYGYQFVIHDHPNPHKAARGQAKRTLELDPLRAPVVRTIYDRYLAGGVGITQIRDLLNTDPQGWPPPTPVDPARSVGAWSRSSVWEVLRNPKYTGYQVWNRRARKKGSNRLNPPDTWIWSDEPAHPAIVNREEYAAAQARAVANQRSRQGPTDDTASVQPRTEYLYRGLLHCGICGLRMWGNHRRSSTYYSCQPSHQRSANIPAEHPKTIYLNEKRLNTALFTYLGTAIFGPDRLDYWTRCLDAAAGPERTAPAAERIKATQAELADLERRLGRQLLNLETEETTPALRRRVAARVAELEEAITERGQRIEALTEQATAEAPTFADVAPLLAALPVLATGLDATPQRDLRALFDQLNLEVVYQPAEHALDVGLTLYDDPGDERTDQPPRADLRRTSQVPPAGFEPAPPPPEGGALSPELRGPGTRPR
jgi:site-specific DNA recombinase